MIMWTTRVPNKDAIVLWQLNSLGNMGLKEVAGQILPAFNKVAGPFSKFGCFEELAAKSRQAILHELAHIVNSVIANECPHLATAFTAFGSNVLDGRVISTHNMCVVACKNLDANSNAMFQWDFRQNMSADPLVANEGCEHDFEHHEPSEMCMIQSVAYEGCDQIFENRESRNVSMLDSLCQLSIEPECELSLKEVNSVSQSQYNENVGGLGRREFSTLGAYCVWSGWE
ncbi:hypothetical protein VNO78_10637 [Psophocarpus tetragonolobus]|uniref:Uncharacterized protein n=1 Tax=Psophocarpus tetragonolobus TaxID=3891 RepID=A0AAN9SRR6_PSOTE